jgi:hypothetical protein
MAQLTGPIQFTGSIGNIRSYYNKKLKRNILSTKGGASRDDILNNPEFARTRENMNEFKACGMWSSLTRKALYGISNLYEGNYFSEIIKLGKEIQLHDEGHPRGYRSIGSSKTSALLTTLVFNSDYSFDRILSVKTQVSLSDDKKTVTLSLPGVFCLKSMVTEPVEVTTA